MASEHKKKKPALGGGNVAAQAGILAAASILSRIIGLLYRSPLTAIIGDEGNGYYGTAINIYTIVLMVSSFGVPAAISKQMAQKMAVGDYKNAQKVFHCSMVYALAVGVAGSMLLYFGAGVLVPPNSVPVLQVFAPTVFLFGILGVLRGYFQANQSMLQTSVSQILEQQYPGGLSSHAHSDECGSHAQSDPRSDGKRSGHRKRRFGSTDLHDAGLLQISRHVYGEGAR